MSEYVREKMWIPASIKEAGNRLAAIFDFDSGGGRTFNKSRWSSNGSEPASHLLADTAIKPEFLEIIENPVRVMAALTQLAEAYGRDLPVQADVEAFCNNVLVGEQPDLVRIVQEEIQ